MASIDPSSLPATESPRSLLDRHAWLTYVLPMAVYSLIGALEPSPGGGKTLGMEIPYSAYPVIYTVKIAMTLAAMAFVLPGYRQFRRGPGLTAALVGGLGIVVWVGLWQFSNWIGLTPRLADLMGKRPEFNPLQELAATPAWAWTFLLIRFFGLVLVVPVMEEFFLRGFLMRLVIDQDWWKVPFGKVNAAAVAVSIIYAAFTHPAELLAAMAWFGMVTWLMVRTRNPWDCVLAHSVTNLLLGIYVVTWQQWALW